VADACNNRIAVGEPRLEERRLVGASRRPEAPGLAPDQAVAGVSEEPFAWEVFVGQPGLAGVDDGRGGAARLSGPQGLAWGPDGALWVADGRARSLRRVTTDGSVTTVAVKSERLTGPLGVAVDGAGICTVFRRLADTGGGDAAGRAPAAGWRDGEARVGGRRRLCGPLRFRPVRLRGAAGSVYVADYNNHTVRRVTPDGAVTTVAGRAGQAGTVDGPAAVARLSRPVAVVAGKGGELFVAAEKQDPPRCARRLGIDAGRGRPVRTSRRPRDRCEGQPVRADRERHAIWKVTPRGEVTKLGGSELAMGGSGWLVTGLAVGRDGSVYVR
jgi:hypothetical protein